MSFTPASERYLVRFWLTSDDGRTYSDTYPIEAWRADGHPTLPVGSGLRTPDAFAEEKYQYLYCQQLVDP